MSKIKVIIPAYNEEKAIAHVIKEIPNSVSEIIIISNNSTDNTIKVATAAGATVLSENRKGYGYACLKGMEYISKQEKNPILSCFRWRLF
jgi:glycosyltransferase involved in cell wall biosynthesis